MSAQEQGRCFLQNFKAAVDRWETLSCQPRLTLIRAFDVCFGATREDDGGLFSEINNN